MANGKVIRFPSPRSNGDNNAAALKIPTITVNFISWPGLSLQAFVDLRKILDNLQGQKSSHELVGSFEGIVRRYTDAELAKYVNAADPMKVAVRPVFYAAIEREMTRRMNRAKKKKR